MNNNSFLVGMRAYFNNIFSSPFLIIVLCVAILLVALFIFLLIKNIKTIYKFIPLIFILLITVFICLFYKETLEFFDNMVESIVHYVLFPSISLIVILYSIFTIYTIIYGMKGKNHLTTGINYTLLTIITAVLLSGAYFINKNGINITDGILIYKNNIILFLLQINMYIYLLWIVLLIIVSSTNSIYIKNNNLENYKKEKVRML